MFFRIKAQDYSGNTFTEVIEADSIDAIIEKLERRKLIPLDISPLSPLSAWVANVRKKKITTEEVIELLKNMRIIAKSGLPIHSGLTDLADDSINRTFREMVYAISDDVNQGLSLHQAFSKHHKVFPPVILNLIQIGEVTGQMDTALQRGAEFLERITQLKKKTKSALIYPSFALAAILGALTVWLVVVLPQITKIFDEMDVELPLATKAIIAISDFFQEHIGTMVLTLIAIAIALRVAYKRSKKVQYFFHKATLNAPIIKHVIAHFNIAYITEYLRLSVISGVPLLQGLHTLKEDYGNLVFQDLLEDVHEEIRQGSQLSDALRQHGRYFTPFMLRMMQVGEVTGDLDQQLQVISSYYYDKVDYFANNIGKIIEPAILLLVGGFMAFIMIGLMGPIYDIIANTKF